MKSPIAIWVWVATSALWGVTACGGPSPAPPDAGSPPTDAVVDASLLTDGGLEVAGPQDAVLLDVSDLGLVQDVLSDVAADVAADAAPEVAPDVLGLVCESFAGTIQPILDAACVSCHKEANPVFGLDLSAGAALDSLVNMPSVYDPTLFLVVPGDPDASFLIEKLGPSPSNGGTMPTAAPALEPTQIEAIAAWIEAGANAAPYACVGEDAGPADTGPEDTYVPPADVPQDVVDAVASDVSPIDASEVAQDVSAGDTPEEVTVDPPLPACETPLQVSATPAMIATYTLVTLTVSGGTGQPSLSWVSNASGGTFGQGDLQYLSGGVGNTTDVVRVSDANCSDEVDISFQVVSDPLLSPAMTVLPPGNCLTFTVQGGSGSFAFELLSVNPKGTLDAAGLYVAGAEPGEDLVRVTDTVTARYAQATVVVSTTADFSFGAPQYWLPVGGSVAFDFEVGSGSPSLTIQGDGYVTIEGNTVTGVSPGTLTLDAVETSLTCPGANVAAVSASTIITVVDALSLPSYEWTTSWTHAYETVDPGDIDGDGYADAIVSDGAASLGGAFAGVVNVYKGTAAGLDPTPALSISGTATWGLFGASLDYEDLTGDGIADLIVGAPGQSVAGTQSGAVTIYPGQAGGLFDIDNPIVRAGTYMARFGTSLATCDFNNDGHMDLAVGAPQATSSSPYLVYRGYVALYLGGDAGLPLIPSETLWATLPVGENGAWGGVEGLAYGTRMASGDHDGDGFCDLAVANDPEANIPDAPASYLGGMVALHRGSGDVGLLGFPARHWVTTYPPGLGSDLLLSDLDGDGAAELIVGHEHRDWATPKSSPDVFIFAGEALPAEPETFPSSLDDAIWTSDTGPGGGKATLRLAVGDVSGDGLPDLIHSYSMSDPEIATHYGTQGGFFELAPSSTLAGTDVGNGACVGTTGDLTGDGAADVVSCQRGGNQQPSALGASLILSLDPAASPLTLESGSLTAASEIGSSLVTADLDGDGLMELIIGSPGGYAGPSESTQSGVVYVVPNQANGLDPASPVVLVGPEQYWSRVGSVVERAGDFDGDGISDLLVTNSNELMPSSDKWPGWPANVQGAAACDTGSEEPTGAVRVYRGVSGGDVNGAPSAIIYPEPLWSPGDPEALSLKLLAVGGFDYDGDGLDDVVVGQPRRDGPDGTYQAGKVTLYRGRPLGGGGTEIVCTYDAAFEPGSGTLRLGAAMTPLGDLDGDGCDELAISAPGTVVGSLAPAIPWDGRVVVLYGFGPNCAQSVARVATLQVSFPMSGFGWSMDGSADIDGDGLRDLLVSAPFFLVGPERYGAVFIVNGTSLVAAPTEDNVDGILGATPQAVTLPISFASSALVLSPESNAGVVNLLYTLPPGGVYADIPLFGYQVSYVAGIGDHGFGIAVGIPNRHKSPTHDRGEVRLYRWTDALTLGGKNLALSGIFVGQSWKPGSRLGHAITSGTWDGKPTLVVGGPGADPKNVPDQVDNGAVYLLPIAPSP